MARYDDDEDPISPLLKPRGKGGIMIMWKKDLDPYITSLADGSTRVQLFSSPEENQPSPSSMRTCLLRVPHLSTPLP